MTAPAPIRARQLYGRGWYRKRLESGLCRDCTAESFKSGLCAIHWERKLGDAARYRARNRERIRARDRAKYLESVGGERTKRTTAQVMADGDRMTRSKKQVGSQEHWRQEHLERAPDAKETCARCLLIVRVQDNLRMWAGEIYHNSCLNIMRLGLKIA